MQGPTGVVRRRLNRLLQLPNDECFTRLKLDLETFEQNARYDKAAYFLRQDSHSKSLDRCGFLSYTSRGAILTNSFIFFEVVITNQITKSNNLHPEHRGTDTFVSLSERQFVNDTGLVDRR